MNIFCTTDIDTYMQYMRDNEKSEATIAKYAHALREFLVWLPEGETVTKALAISYKNYLQKTCAASTINAKLAGINGFFQFMGWEECRVKPLRIQRRTFCSAGQELSREEYMRLVETAEKNGLKKLSLLIQLMASTGMRVSEIAYVTVETVKKQQVEIELKGKIRQILLLKKLCKKLKTYMKKNKIVSGTVFQNKEGGPMDRKLIWAQMKRLAVLAGVDPEKVFPHNLRHLFAREFYAVEKDLSKLADILGHSSIHTTRIYLMSSGVEHKRSLERMHLVS